MPYQDRQKTMKMDMRKEPKITEWVLWGIFTFTVITIGEGLDNDTIRAIIFSVSVFTGVACGVTLLRWLVFNWLDMQERARRISTITPESELLDKMRYLTPETVELFRDIQVGNTGRIEGTTNLYGVEVPNDFIIHYLTKSTKGNQMKPIREFSDGSRGREFARLITKALVEGGAAVEHAGNLSATIVSVEKIPEALGWEV